MKTLVFMGALALLLAGQLYAVPKTDSDDEKANTATSASPMHQELKKQHNENEVLDRYPLGDATENY